MHHCDMKLPNFIPTLYGVGEHNRKVVFFFFKNLDTVFSDSTWETFANICQINWIELNKIDEVCSKANSLFEWFFGFVVIQNFSTTAKCCNDLSSLSQRRIAASSPFFARRATRALRRACSQGYTIFGVKTHTPTRTHCISHEISNHQVASKKLRKCLGANSISNGINRFNKTSKCSSGKFCTNKPRFISSRFSSKSLIIIRAGVLSPNSHFRWQQ